MNITPETAYEALKTGKERVAFLLSGNALSEGSEFGTVRVRLAFVKDSSELFNNSIGFYDNGYCDKHQYKDLELKASLSSYHSSTERPELVFSSNLSEKVYSLQELECMTKTMRTITRKLNKIADQEGFTSDFEEMVIRLGRVLNVKSFYVQQENGIQWKRNDSMADLRPAIKNKIASVLSEIGYTEVQVA